MKSFIAMALALLFVGESFFPRGLAMSEISKVYELIEHFQEHLVEIGDDISFAEFLWMHYNPASDHEDASHHHERLPKLTLGSGFVSICLPVVQNMLQVNTVTKYLISLQPIEYTNGYYYLFFNDVLNPPQ
jgi:hypothetical protein